MRPPRNETMGRLVMKCDGDAAPRWQAAQPRAASSAALPRTPSLAGGLCAASVVGLRSHAPLHELREGPRHRRLIRQDVETPAPLARRNHRPPVKIWAPIDATHTTS